MVTFIHSIVEIVGMKRRRFQQVLESTMFRSIWRETTPATLVPPVARLNWLLSDKLPTDEIFIYPAMGDDGRRPAAYLLQQYISRALVALS